MRTANRLSIVAVLLVVATVARVEARTLDTSPRTATTINAPSQIVSAAHPLAAVYTTLPPEEKPKTHWPWWLRILAVIGVLVFIRLVAGSVRNNPGKPGPS